MAHAGDLKALIAEETLKWSTVDLRARLEAEDVPHAVVLKREQVPDDRQVAFNNTLTVTQHPAAGPLREPNPAAHFPLTPAAIRRHAPLLGEQTDEILSELGHSAAEIAALRKDGAVA